MRSPALGRIGFRSDEKLGQLPVWDAVWVAALEVLCRHLVSWALGSVIWVIRCFLVCFIEQSLLLEDVPHRSHSWLDWADPTHDRDPGPVPGAIEVSSVIRE